MTRSRRLDITIVAVAFVATGLTAAAPIRGLDPAGQYAVATMVFAAVLWVTGALPLPVTALLIPVLLAGFGVYDDLGAALAGFADPVVFLLLAGFVLAAALSKHGIDRLVAYTIMARLGSSPRRLVLAVMLATAALSMLISNTATTAMMVPIAIGLVGEVTGVVDDPEAPVPNFQVAMLLGTAYAASIGGVGTLIGTPPNAIVVGQLRELAGVSISFVEWLAIGLPLVVVTLPVAWLVLIRVYPPEVGDVSRARERARRNLREAGPLDTEARRVVAVFAATAGLWLLGGASGILSAWLPATWATTLFGGPGRSIFGPGGHQGLLYFVIVGLAAVPALVLAGGIEWEDATDIDWGTLLLLGGGISLANALSDTDATTWLADVTIGSLVGSPVLVVLLAVIALTVLVGELASNTAMAAIIAPLLIAVGPAYAAALDTTAPMAATFFAVAGAIAASYGFALPVATPPNAIVYGAGYLTRAHMLRVGVVLDVVIILLSTATIAVLVRVLWPLVIA